MRVLLANPALPERDTSGPLSETAALIAEERVRINRVLFERFIRSKYEAFGIEKTFYDYPDHTASLGLLSLAAVLQQHGHEVDYLQLERGNDASALVQCAAAYDLVGVTALCTTLDDALEVLRQVKHHHGESLKTMIGGPEVSRREFREEELEGVDVVVRGEAEVTLPHLLERLQQTGVADEIAGVSHCCEREWHHNSVTPRLTEQQLNALPVPAYELVGDASRTQLYVQLARGCDFNCRFCSEDTGVRYLGAASIEATLRALERFRQRNLIFVVDANFAGPSSRRFLEDFERARLASQSSNFFYVQSRVQNMTWRRLKRLFDARVINHFFGIESTSDHVLRLSNKRTTWQEIHDGLAAARDFFLSLGFAIPPYRANFIQGLPGEDAEIAAESLQRRRQLLDEGLIVTVHDNLFQPLAGSDFCDRAEEYGLRLPDGYRAGQRASVPGFEGAPLGGELLQKYHLQMKQLANDVLRERYGLGVNRPETVVSVVVEQC